MDADSTRTVQDSIILQSVGHSSPTFDVLHTARLLEAQLRSIETMCEDRKAQRAFNRKRADELDKLLTSLRALEQREKNTSLKLSKIWAKSCGIDVGRPGVMSVVQTYGITPYMRQAPRGSNQDGVSGGDQRTHVMDSIALFDGPTLYRFEDTKEMTEETMMEDKEDHDRAGPPQRGDHLLDSTWRSPLPLLADAIEEEHHHDQQLYSISFSSSSVNGSSQTNLLESRPQFLRRRLVAFDSANDGNTKTTTGQDSETGPVRKRRKTFSDDTEEKGDAGVQDYSTKSTKRSWKLRRGRA